MNISITNKTAITLMPHHSLVEYLTMDNLDDGYLTRDLYNWYIKQSTDENLVNQIMESGKITK